LQVLGRRTRAARVVRDLTERRRERTEMRTTARVAAAVLAAAALLGVGLSAFTLLAPSASTAGDMAGMRMDASDAQSWANAAGAAFVSDGRTRTYYVGADEVVWNYAPRGRNEITGKPFDEVADTYVRTGPGRIGSRYLKCLYRGYTDGTFRHLQKRPVSAAYLGLLGPIIRAEVGDTIRVVFRNGCRFPASVHPHGVFYAKGSEGAPYNDGTAGKAKGDDAVPRGGKRTYVWRVPERAGPGPGDGSSVMWMYHSHTDEVADTYAGLMGPIEITRRGMAKPDGSPKDVDEEFFVMFSVMNEGESPYLLTNLHRFAKRPYPKDPDADEGFGESNLMHSINGYVFGNQPLMTMHKGDHVRWYVMSMGTEVDLHTPHWHGNTVLVNGMRMDVLSLLPASMIVADMVPDDPGIWLFHCHVDDHIRAGMLTRYRVLG
jgi:manganese oxidase